MKNDFQQNDVKRCLNRDTFMYIYIYITEYITIIYIYMFACTVYVRFSKSVHPKSDGLPSSIMSKKDSPVLTVYRSGPFYPKPITQAEMHIYIYHIYI